MQRDNTIKCFVSLKHEHKRTHEAEDTSVDRPNTEPPPSEPQTLPLGGHEQLKPVEAANRIDVDLFQACQHMKHVTQRNPR